MIWYYELLAKRPYIVLIAVGVFSLASIIVSFVAKGSPNFSDPTLGFEARGTEIGERLKSWKNLKEKTRGQFSTLVYNPNDPPIDRYESRKNVSRPDKKNDTEQIKKDEIVRILQQRFQTNVSLLNENELQFQYRKQYHNSNNDSDDDSFSNNYDDEDGYDGIIVNGTNETNSGEESQYGTHLFSPNESEITAEILKDRKRWEDVKTIKPSTPFARDVTKLKDGFFCTSPNNEYAHFVIQRNNNLPESLFELGALLAICDIESKLGNISYYDKLCENPPELKKEKCCRQWSLPNYIALLANKTSCFDIDDFDIGNVKALLRQCSPYYLNMELSDDCIVTKCNVPIECRVHDAVYSILHYLVDMDFTKGMASRDYLTSTMLFVPIGRGIKALPFYHAFEKAKIRNELVSIVAMDLGVKHALFDEYLLKDTWLIALGAVSIMFCMWIYTNSVFITFMAIVAVVLSLGVSYFFYIIIFNMAFFPFMNLLAIIVVIGIGADNVFILTKLWSCVIIDQRQAAASSGTRSSNTLVSGERSYADSLANQLATTLRHASISMFVTSLTTAIAFYTSIINSITAIRCFGIFAGTTVMVNYMFMITWIPATISLYERVKWFENNRLNRLHRKLFQSISNIGTYIESGIISVVTKIPLILILILGSIGIMSGIIVFYWPRLRLPDTPNLKLFNDDHPFEIYDHRYKKNYFFERTISGYDTFNMSLRFVWGVKPIDNGNYFNPASNGDLQLDSTFNISAIDSQLYMLEFCKNIKNQSFHQHTRGALLPRCFIENFIQLMDRRCYDAMIDIDRTPCCESTTFPFPPHIFEYCLPILVGSLFNSPHYVYDTRTAGPIFERRTNVTKNNTRAITKAVVVEYESTQPYTQSYSKIKPFYYEVKHWLDGMRKTAPPGMKNVWFTSEFEFFDIQDTLSNGTVVSIVVAMIISFIVMCMVTLNIIVSVYAIITVSFIIITTVAALVLIGWRLNILESIAVISAIGLSVDFSLHYGVQYRMSPDIRARRTATLYAMKRMIGPTAMAAITTALAGLFMIPSHVLPYIHIGKFLCIIMTVSWTYATFFLMPILITIGPQNRIGQFDLLSFTRKSEESTNKRHSDLANRPSNQGTVSEQLLSQTSSAAGDIAGGSETHELHSLPSTSIVTESLMETRPINFDRAFKRCEFINNEPSPTSISNITEVLPDEHSSDT